jgi:hypothetical protein
MLDTNLRSCRWGLLIVCGVAGALAGIAASGQADPTPAPALTGAEIVHQLMDHNEDRADRLQYYTSQRHYQLQYHGFPHSAEASMDVEAICRGHTKTFRVLSESGSHVLINHVLKRLLKGEHEAAGEQAKNTLAPANYSFRLLGTETENGRKLFVLRVDPKKPSKFLFRGRIWVDTEDDAVAKIEAEPSEHLSFWIRNTEITHLYTKVGEFWLPKQNTSVTKVRLGGTATLTIDYGKYEIGTAENRTSRPSELIDRFETVGQSDPGIWSR